MPKVSFLMSVYNGARYLPESLGAILRQDMDDFDLVLVDDGSTDQTALIVEKFNSPKIRYLPKSNGGLVSGLNFGLDAIDSEFVARIDDDDICFPNRLSAQLDFLRFTGADAVANRVVNIDRSGNPRDMATHRDNLLNINAAYLPAREPYLPHPFMFLRRSVFEKTGPYRNAHLAEDADLCWRIHQHHRMAISDQLVGLYRVHSGSISSASPVAGRVQAFYAQLAALNHQRRLTGRDEIPYHLSMSEAKINAKSIAALVDTIRDSLSSEEEVHLTAAAGLKLLDLGNWRDYKLTEKDFFDTQTALDLCSDLSNRNLKTAKHTLMTAKSKIFAPSSPAKPSWKSRLGDRILGTSPKGQNRH